MTSLFPPFNRRSSFRKQPYFYEAGRGVNYKSTGGPFPTLDLNFLSGTLDPRITFSRASNAMVTDSTGKITYAPNNLILRSQDFSNASWQKLQAGTGVTPVVTANYGPISAPDGTFTASRIQFDLGATPASATSRIYQPSGLSSGNTVNSVYLRTTDGSTKTLYIIGPGVGVSITVTGVWQRFSSVGSPQIQFGLSGASGAGGLTTSTTADILAWGAQCELVTYQTSPSTYVPTTTAAYYGPRFDYDPVTLASKGLLIEEARTNVLTYSEQVDNAAWTKGAASISANATPAPDGTSTADKLVEDNTTSVHQVNQAVTTTAIAYTFSVYLKAAGRNWAILGITDSGSTVRLTWFDLANGAVGTVGTNITASITPVGNSWYRCSVTVAAAVAGFNTFRIYTSTGNNTTTYTGDGTSGIFVWGAQSEAGSFATSYIPTVASSVTRSADIASMTGTNFSSWFNASAGTFTSKFDVNGVDTTARRVVLCTIDSGNNRFSLRATDITVNYPIAAIGTGTGVVSLNGTTLTSMVSANVAVAFGTDMALAQNGAVTGTSASAAAVVASSLSIGMLSTNANQLNGHIQTITYYNQRLPNAKLQALTT